MREKRLYNLSILIKILGAVAFFSSCSGMSILNPKGPIGKDESFLIYMAFALMLIVVIPVFVMAFWFARRYRASNKKATYKPQWGHSTVIELFIWLIPVAIIAVLSWLTWTRTFKLDPYKPLKGKNQSLRVEVVSTDWNYLFIYPDYNIAIVNELIIPSNTPLSFRLTSSTVMTSFFIPQLGSQIYAMAGMQTWLHLMAEDTGTYRGQNMEFSGPGYHTMHFKVITETPEEFSKWVDKAKQSPDSLSMDEYSKINQPVMNYPITTYSSVIPNLFDHIMSPFMDWMGKHDKMKMNHTHSGHQNASECEKNNKQVK